MLKEQDLQRCRRFSAAHPTAAAPVPAAATAEGEPQPLQRPHSAARPSARASAAVLQMKTGDDGCVDGAPMDEAEAAAEEGEACWVAPEESAYADRLQSALIVLAAASENWALLHPQYGPLPGGVVSAAELTRATGGSGTAAGKRRMGS